MAVDTTPDGRVAHIPAKSGSGTGRLGFAARLAREIPLLWRQGELTVDEIAHDLRLTRRTVIRYLDRSRTERMKHNVSVLRRRGLVPLAIADVLALKDGTVRRYLLELARSGTLEPVPAYLTVAWDEREFGVG